MRLSPLIIGLSLAANAGLGYALWQRTAPAPETHAVAATGSAKTTAPRSTSVSTSSDGSATSVANGTLSPELARELPGLFQRLTEGDFVAGITQLRAAGMDEETLGMLAQVVAIQKYRLFARSLGNNGAEFYMWGSDRAKTEAQREAQKRMLEFQRQLSENARDAGIHNDWFSMMRNDVPGLSDEKSKQLARLEQDHQELRSRIQMEAAGMMLERDTEQLKFIDAEFKKDLAAILTPEELEAWTLHRSQTAQSLRAEIAYMEPTDEEFRGILKLQEAFNDAWPAEYGASTDWQKRHEAQQEMKAKIAELLGPTRAADYQKATDYEFGTLSNLEYRLELPKGTADRVLELRKQTEQAAQKIRADKSLADADRQESLKVLADQAREDLSAALSAEGFKAYKAQHGHWIDQMAN